MNNLNMGLNKEILFKAVAQKKVKLVRLLVEGGADVNAQSSDGKTALIYACMKFGRDEDEDKCLAIVQTLLKNGTDPTIKDGIGRTALMYAFAYNLSEDVIKVLLVNGADLEAVDFYGYPTLSYVGNAKALKRYAHVLQIYGNKRVIIVQQKQTEMTEATDHGFQNTGYRCKKSFKTHTKGNSKQIVSSDKPTDKIVENQGPSIDLSHRRSSVNFDNSHQEARRVSEGTLVLHPRNERPRKSLQMVTRKGSLGVSEVDMSVGNIKIKQYPKLPPIPKQNTYLSLQR